MFGNAKESVVLVPPTTDLGDPKVLALITEAPEREAKASVIGNCEAPKTSPQGVERRTGDLIAFDLMADDEATVRSLPDQSARNWLDSLQVADHFKQFLEPMWKSSSRGKSDRRKGQAIRHGAEQPGFSYSLEVKTDSLEEVGTSGSDSLILFSAMAAASERILLASSLDSPM